jgi:hypothetical protein
MSPENMEPASARQPQPGGDSIRFPADIQSRLAVGGSRLRVLDAGA